MPLYYSIIPSFYFVILFEYSFSLLLIYPNILLPYSSSDFLFTLFSSIIISFITAEQNATHTLARKISLGQLTPLRGL